MTHNPNHSLQLKHISPHIPCNTVKPGIKGNLRYPFHLGVPFPQYGKAFTAGLILFPDGRGLTDQRFREATG